MIANSFTLTNLLQVVVAVGLLNVWLLRFHRATAYRGGSATTMVEEFSAYGLPRWSCYAVGATKITCALLLLAGFWEPRLVVPAATVVAVLMLGALLMHLKVRDPLRKHLPAFAVFVMCATISLRSMSSLM